MNLVVLSGGRGLEHQISIKSGENFCSLLDPSWNVFKVHLSQDGVFWFDGNKCVFEENLFKVVDSDSSYFFDYIFPIVHGIGVENGDLQGFFSQTPLIANSLFSSAISFDKIHAKECAIHLNIPVLPFISLYENKVSFLESCDFLKSNVLFLKPSDNGSSFGCYKIGSAEDFESARSKLEKITKYIMIEPFVSYIEASCSVLFDEVSDVILIRHNADWFSYDQKYIGNEFNIEFLEEEVLSRKIQEYSMALFRCFRMSFCCRFDFFVNPKTGDVFFNEANSLPGLGERSLFFFCFQKRYSQKILANKMIINYINRYF